MSKPAPRESAICRSCGAHYPAPCAPDCPKPRAQPPHRDRSAELQRDYGPPFPACPICDQAITGEALKLSRRTAFYRCGDCRSRNTAPACRSGAVVICTDPACVVCCAGRTHKGDVRLTPLGWIVLWVVGWSLYASCCNPRPKGD